MRNVMPIALLHEFIYCYQMNEELIISDKAQLYKLKGFKQKYKRVYLKIPQLNIDENVKWTKTINEEYTFKGMKTAMLYVSIAIIVGCIAMISYYILTNDFPTKYLKYWIFVSVFMGIIGKYIGRLFAYIRLNRTIEMLSKIID